MKRAEDIVRALAVVPRSADDGGSLMSEGLCFLCMLDPCKAECPHRLAVEWAAATDAGESKERLRCDR